MSVRQLLRQLEYLARSATWDDSPNEVIFAKDDGSIASALTWDQLIDHIRFPAIVFSFLSSTGNSEHPQLKTVQLRATIVAKHDNDRLGRLVALGGHQAFPTGQSESAGILQIQEAVWDKIQKLGREDGIVYQLTMTGERLTAGAGVEDAIALAVLEIDMEAIIYEQSIYNDVHNLAGSESGGDVTLTWEDHPDRYDRITTNGIVVRRKAGSNPTGPTDGTSVGTVNTGVQTIVDTAPGSGTWYYGVFSSYDETNDPPATAEKYGDGAFVTVAVP